MAFFSRFFTRAGSEAAGIAIGATAVPALLPAAQYIVNEAWSLHPDKPPDVYILAQGVAQGQVDPDSARTWAHEQGISDGAFAALVNTANVGPALGQAYSAWRRGELTEAQMVTAFKRLGIEVEWVPALLALKDEPLDPSTIANAVHRGIMRDPSLIVREPPTAAGKVEQVPPSTLDPATEAAWSGIDHERLRVEVGTTGLPPGLVQMLDLMNRGVVTQDDVQRAVSQSNLRNEYMDVVLALARQLLTPTQYVDAHLRGYITAPEMYAGTALHGMTKPDTDILFESHGRPLTVHQIVTGEARGGAYNGPIDNIEPPILASLREGSIKPPFYNLANANRYSLPSAFVMRALTQSGVWTAAKAEQRLLESGWIPEDAKQAAQAWAGGGGTTGDPHVAKAQTHLWNTTHNSYRDNETGEAQARTALTTLGLDQAAQDQVVSLWNAEKALIRRELSAADLRKAYQKQDLNVATGVAWTRDEAKARLIELGYDAEDAENYLNIG